MGGITEQNKTGVGSFVFANGFKRKKDTFRYLEDPMLSPIHDEILDVCKKLDLEKENHGGKKNYHTMIALYFLDLAKVWRHLRYVCKEGSTVCFVIGDSAPYGVYE